MCVYKENYKISLKRRGRLDDGPYIHVSSEYRGCHPDDPSIYVINKYRNFVVYMAAKYLIFSMSNRCLGMCITFSLPITDNTEVHENNVFVN